MAENEKMTYAGTGVDYDVMDPFKRMAQQRAAKTANNALHTGTEPVEWSRGESVYVVKIGDEYYGQVEEGLGTKNLAASTVQKLAELAETICRIAKAMEIIKKGSRFDKLAQCTVAMIVNDMITLGIFPITCAMHLAVGDSRWFDDRRRALDLIKGWGHACDLARCIWSGGETPTLKGDVYPEAVVLSGSAFGKAKKGHLIDPRRIEHGDAIMFFESSGIHANGLTLARGIADKLPDGYLSQLSDGRFFGEALLDPTHIYVGLMEKLIDSEVDIHYAVNITGHGWRKLMRANQSFSYVVQILATQLPIFEFIQKHGPVDDREAYGNLNMGAGFAIYVPESEVPVVEKLAAGQPFKVYRAGYIERSETKRVVILRKELEYSAESLGVR
jgi:phosphoribosylformylglycinamidine cyclo-ligase